MLPIGIEVDHILCPFGQRIIHSSLESGSLTQIDRVAQIIGQLLRIPAVPSDDPSSTTTIE
jgi:hypothetical protein